MKILVIGRHGQVAQSLIERGAVAGIPIASLSRPDIDLSSPSGTIVETVVRAGKGTDLIVNAAAYTGVDKAESEPDVAMAVNAHAPGAIGRAARELGVPLIHLSTDYVFDGGKEDAWTEDDPVAPLGVYGRSKLEGERAVAAATDRHVILRTAWVYAPFGQNFVKTILRLSSERERLTIVADQHGTPTSALDIADAILDIARRLDRQPDDQPLFGVFHLAGRGRTNWAQFAEAIVDGAAARGRSRTQIVPITTAQYPTPARRPANSVLSTERIARTYGIELPVWSQSLEVVLDRLIEDRSRRA